MSALAKAALGIASATQKITSIPPGAEAPWGPNDAPFLIVLGQSNAQGTGATLTAGEQINTPMTNVRALLSTQHYSLTHTDVTWSGMTSLKTTNIGSIDPSLGMLDHAACLSTEFARRWQAHITAGNSLGLPDLYVILAAWGSQGMCIDAQENRWAPERSATDIESLYPRITRTVRLAIANLKAAGKVPRIVAVHWNQWEREANEDATTPADSAFRAAHNFSRIRRGFDDALGCQAPWAFYCPRATSRYGTIKTPVVIRAVEAVQAIDPVNVRLVDLAQAPFYTGVAPTFGVFVADNVHYTAAAHKWIADQEFARITGGWRGVPAGQWPHGTTGMRELAERVAAIPVTTQAQIEGFARGVIPRLKFVAAESAIAAFSYPSGIAGATMARSSTSAAQTWNIVRDSTSGRKVWRPSEPLGGNRQSILQINSAPADARYGTVRFVVRGRAPIGVCFRVKPATPSFRDIGFGYAALAFYDSSISSPNFNIGNQAYFWNLATATPVTIAGNTPVSGYTPDTANWREWEYSLTAAAGGTCRIRYRPDGGDANSWTTLFEATGVDAALTTAGLTEGRIGLIVGLGVAHNSQGSTDEVGTWAQTYGSLNLREFEFVSAD